MTESTPRKRSRAACLSCQSRKRKCSGEQPCSTCAQAGIACVFSDLPRKKRARSGSMYRASLSGLDERQRLHPPSDGRTHPVPVAKPASSAPGSAASPGSYTRVNDSARPMSHSLEANSGAAFVRKLGLRIDPARAPRLHLFAWNVGERRVATEVSVYPAVSGAGPISTMISEDEMRRLARIYFEKVHPCYAFLDRQTVLAHIAQRWSATSISAETAEQPYDVVLLGIAAFGHLFSRREMLPVEIRIVDAARILLERSVLGADTPTIDTVTGWVLRAAYLRMTASPHAAWMASCTLMHLVEAAGLHLEIEDPEATGLIQAATSEPQVPNGTNTVTQPSNHTNLRRRLFGMARHLNTWISFDLGRSRVVLHGTSSHSPSTPATNADLYHLLPLSESLDPTGPTPQDLPDLETALTAVLDLVYTEPSLILVQCNLMLCIYRRVRAINPHAPLPGRALDRVLALAGRGLRAARAMVAATCPWHQVANVPFQVVCTLLAIDNRAALALLPDAMTTLREVLAAYDTGVMREAYSTAYLLIALHQRRKEDDTRALGDVLRANAAAAVPPVSVPAPQVHQSKEDARGLGNGGEVLATAQMPMQTQARVHDVLGPVSDAELSWLGDLMIDMPSLQNFDLDQFLMTDVPWPLPEMGI
ncbi:putative C6 transcription factor [Penicillium brasilianum]|uniref:Putative C6 transcription factor n=1 Tax=Penicillium brasilianum TaxID=104259 RepID=A0A1S9RWC9_PENBI|nr:putative C6 transcription factor [Penicillium brasilianum]